MDAICLVGALVSFLPSFTSGVSPIPSEYWLSTVCR